MTNFVSPVSAHRLSLPQSRKLRQLHVALFCSIRMKSHLDSGRHKNDLGVTADITWVELTGHYMHSPGQYSHSQAIGHLISLRPSILPPSMTCVRISSWRSLREGITENWSFFRWLPPAPRHLRRSRSCCRNGGFNFNQRGASVISVRNRLASLLGGGAISRPVLRGAESTSGGVAWKQD